MVPKENKNGRQPPKPDLQWLGALAQEALLFVFQNILNFCT